MPEQKLEVRMLGGFSVMYAGKEIVIDRSFVSKTTQLFQLFLTHAQDGVSKATLIDALYGREEVENKNGSLNNTIFRLRRQLKAAGLPDSNYICIQSGMCTWDETIPVWVDVCEFEKLVQEGQECSKEEQLDAYRRAVAIYAGEFLPNMIGEDWVTVENVHCRDLYARCVQELCEDGMMEERYEEVLRVSSAAAAIYPFEDWQLWQIDSLMAMSRYQEAMTVYEKSTQLAFDELGLSPSPEMLRRFRIMGEHVSQTAELADDIKNRLSEKEKAMGAYYCTFPSFVDIYHVFTRMMERSGISVYIMLCTLKHGNGTVKWEESKDRAASKKLASAISGSLRKGDFYTRYSYTQYLIMFSEIKLENCKIVSDRIWANFEKSCSGNYSVDFHVTSIADIDRDEDVPEKYFLNASGIWKE